MASAYQVGIDISMADGVSGTLAAISKNLLGLEGGVMRLTQGFAGLRAGIIGAATALAGIGIVSGLRSIADHADKLLDQQDKLQRAGLSYNEVLRLQGKYYDEINRVVPTATAAEYLKTFNELRSVVGVANAEKITPWSLQLEAIIKNQTGKSAEGEGFKLWRALEMTGRSVSDPEGTQKLADAFAKDIIGSGGKLDANTYQTMAKRAGVAWANAAPDFLSGPMSVVAADLGGDTAGTALMSAYMFMTGANTLSKQQYELLNRAGLIDPSKTTMDKGGRVNVQPGGIIGSSEYTGAGKFDLYGWAQKYLEPRLEALARTPGGPDKSVSRKAIEDVMSEKGLEGMGRMHMNDEQRAAYDSFVAKVGRNRNVMRMLTMFTDPGFLEQITKDLGQWGQARNVSDAYQNAISGNPMLVKEAYNAQWESMMQAVGTPLMEAAIPVMRDLTELFTQFGQWANNNKDTVKAIGVGLASLGIGLTALGTAVVGGVILSAIAAAGPLAAGIGLVAAAVVAGGALIHSTWDKWKEAFTPRTGWMDEQVAKWKEAFTPREGWWGEQKAKWSAAFTELSATLEGAGTKIWTAMKEIGSSFVSAIEGLPGMVSGAISSAIGAIGSAISGALSHLNPFSRTSAPGSSNSTAPIQPASNVVPFTPRDNTPVLQPVSYADGAATRQSSAQPIVVNSNVVVKLDGKQVGKTAVRQILDGSRYQQSVGSQDTRGTWASPSASTGVAV